MDLPPPVITIDHVGHRDSEFTMTWSISNNAGVDVYRSHNLRAWGTPISFNNISGVLTESLPPGDAAYYRLVPAGQNLP